MHYALLRRTPSQVDAHASSTQRAQRNALTEADVRRNNAGFLPHARQIRRGGNVTRGGSSSV